MRRIGGRVYFALEYRDRKPWMTYSAIARPTERHTEPKKPGKFWVVMESFLLLIGLLHASEKPFKDVVKDIRVEDGGRRLVRKENKKMRKPRILSVQPETMNEIKIATPMNINQAAEPADMLKEGRSILCNFSGIEKRNLEQVRFFLMGVVYAIGGTCKKVNDTIWLFTPAHMDVGNIQSGPPVIKKERKDKLDDEVVLDQFFGT